jgi:hypothetical protein
MILPASDEIDDLHVIALAHGGGVKRGAFEDDQIELDGDPARIDLEVLEQLRDGNGFPQLTGLAVERNTHAVNLTDVRANFEVWRSGDLEPIWRFGDFQIWRYSRASAF